MVEQVKQNQNQLLGRNISKPTINIGRHPDNDIVLVGADVQPFHATLMKHNGSFQCVLLSPKAKLALNGKVYAESPITINEFDRIGIGNTDIMFQSNGPDAGIRVFVSQISAEAPVEKYETEEDEDPILVEVLTPQLDVNVDETAEFELEIINGGPIVASIYLRVDGIPEEWVEIDNPVVNLNEAQRKYVKIRVTPPRHYSSTAGTHKIEVTASSPNYYGRQVKKDLDLLIHPYYQFSLGSLSPRQNKIRWRKKTGTTFLPITNEGNDTSNFNISSFDEENGCSFEYKVSEDLQLSRQATIPIDPGEMINLPIEIRPLKPKLFAMRAKQYYYTTNVLVQEQGTSPQVVSGVAISQPLFGWWSIVLTILAILISLFILLQPRINHFGVAAGKDVIELGDTTRLEWSVSPFATRVSVSELEETINRGQTSLTVSPSKSTTYELVSGNWLSGLTGMDYVRKVTVLVVPPAPKIGVFEVDTLEVDKGKPIKIRWSATKVDELILTVDEVIYPLTPETFSGEQEFVLEDDSIITLEAKNASGSELRSYFVDVVAPQIDVVDFTIWVRPATASADYVPRLGVSGDLSGITNVPDPNFPEKLVSLVRDIESESGYRVEFYDENRELSKGEQIMVEWNINGVDTVAIAPFTDELPAQGVQPFFPQESMNFVLTAQSGELEKLFMLPVKVFDGEPPEAPAIEFFKASPVKMLGGGSVEFAWSISGEWTKVQLASGDGVIDDGLFAQGFLKLEVTESATYVLTAWNGEDLSASASLEIAVDPDLLEVGIKVVSAYPDGLFQVGGKTLITVEFFDIPEDEPAPTGEVIITDGTASCTVALPSKSCELVFKTPGIKTIYANYQGDSIYLQADSEGFPEAGSKVKLDVQSSTVTMEPRYSLLSTGNEIPDITTKVFSLDEGIKIKVAVQPSFPLPDDEKSTVNLKICNQTSSSTGDPVIDEDSCTFVGGSKVALAAAPLEPDEIQGYGYAEIVLQKFPSSGKKAFVFNYLHEDNAFEPAEEIQYGIQIKATEIYLNTNVCDPSPAAPFTNCEIGLLQDGLGDPDEAELIFDLYITSNDEELSTIYASPNASKFQLKEAGGTPWTCETKKIGGKWKLACTGKFSRFDENGVDLTMTHLGGDDNYTTKTVTMSFSVIVLYQVTVEINDIAVAAGQTVMLTGKDGVIRFYNGTVPLNSNDSNLLSGELVLEETSGKDNLFGVSSTSNCQLGYYVGSTYIDDGKIYIDSVGSPCLIYFKQAGTFKLIAEYMGNGPYVGDETEEKSITVVKETEVTATWNLADTSLVNVFKDVRIILGAGNDSPGAPNYNSFAPEVLTGKEVKLSITGDDDSCSLIAASEGEEDPHVKKIVYDTAVHAPVVDFKFICTKQPLVVTFSIAFGDDDKDNFSISTKKSVQTSMQANPTTELTYRIWEGNTSITNWLSGAPGVTLKAGVAYKFAWTVTPLIGHYTSSLLDPVPIDSTQEIIAGFLTSDEVEVGFPQELLEAIDWSKSSCGNNSHTAPEVGFSSYSVLERFDYDYLLWRTGYVKFTMETNPNHCFLVFSKQVNVNGALTVFRYASDFNTQFTDSISMEGPNVEKQSVTLSLSGLPSGSQLVGVPLTVTINVAEDTPTLLNPLDTANNGFDDHFTVTSTCGTITDKALTNGNTATFKITSSGYSTCSSADLEVKYVSNSFYNQETITDTISFKKHTPTISMYSESIDLMAGAPATVDVSPNSTVTIDINNSASFGALIPDPEGKVEISLVYKNPGGGTTVIPTANYTVDAVNGTETCTTNKCTIDVDDGEVVFDIDFTTDPGYGTDDYYFQYVYLGDADFFTSLSYREYGPFEIAPAPSP